MTGLAPYNDCILVADEYQQKVWCVSLLSTTKSTFQFRKLLHSVDCYDLACSGVGEVWVACGSSDPPAICLGLMGEMLDQIPSGLVESVTGLAYDDEGCLWIADGASSTLARLTTD